MTSYHKKLIEVALPLPEINDASAYDKMPGIGPHPKGIHHWWARLPLPTARAVLFASVVDDPSAHPEKFPTEAAQNEERERLFDMLREMMQKKMHEHPEVYAKAKEEMLKHCDGKLPPVLDPFAGGGSIPLEASRLGFDAYAADLNPVAVLLNKCNLELIPRWLNHPPINPGWRTMSMEEKVVNKWIGARGLAEDVRYYGKLIRQRAIEKVGHLYPKVKLPEEYGGPEANVIAWIWARTVASPNPVAKGAHVPLISSFWLSSKNGILAWIEPIIDMNKGTWHFEVRTGEPNDKNVIRKGTKVGKKATFKCLLTSHSGEEENVSLIKDTYIKEEGQHGRIGVRLLAIVAEVPRGRVYLSAIPGHESFASIEEPQGVIEEELSYDPRNIWCVPYGIKQFRHLFTPRQLSALITLSELIKDIPQEIMQDALKAGLDRKTAESYAADVTTFLSLNLSRCADLNNSICTWNSSDQVLRNLFKRQAIPLVWDFAEANILSDVVGGWSTCMHRTIKCILTISSSFGHALQVDAADSWNGVHGLLVSTDPPYYDNISYAGLSDFFYVWLRRTIGNLYPELFKTILVPKAPELTASPERFDGNKEKAKEHFETGFRKAFTALREKMDPRFPLTVYYAFKQEDEEAGSDDDERTRKNSVDMTTGWETLLEALLGSGFQITATWPGAQGRGSRGADGLG